MKIAILGWGSLIWNPQTLKYNKMYGWQTNGPILPIEFARISSDGRLTLVITKNGAKVQTLYAQSKYKNLDVAILNLAIREGSGRKSIGYYNKSENKIYPSDFEFIDELKKWIAQNDFDAVIWTNLKEEWKKLNTKINPDKRVDYLQELKGITAAKAEEYIRKAPIQIKTKYRILIEEELNWLPII